MRNHHIPPMRLPLNAMKNPSIIKATPKPRPIWLDVNVAERKSRRARQSTARNMRPPSSGNAGARLKTATVRLMSARVVTTPTTGSGQPLATASAPVSHSMSASRKLDIGPAIAIRNSALGSGGSCSSSATPPKINSVMPCIDMPKYRATIECENSWKTIEKNTPAATAMPIHA